MRDTPDRILEDLVRMAKKPAWKAWAWHAAKEWEELYPAFCRGMQERLKQRMQQEKEQQK